MRKTTFIKENEITTEEKQKLNYIYGPHATHALNISLDDIENKKIVSKDNALCMYDFASLYYGTDSVYKVKNISISEKTLNHLEFLDYELEKISKSHLVDAFGEDVQILTEILEALNAICFNKEPNFDFDLKDRWIKFIPFPETYKEEFEKWKESRLTDKEEN